MSNISPTTPQLKLVRDWIDAYLSLDINNIQPHVSKNFQFQTFPKIANLPDETTGGYVEKFAPIFSLFSKVDVRTRRQKPILRLLTDPFP